MTHERGRSISILTINTLAFTACFAVWVMNGVLVTFLVDNRVFVFDKAEIGWLLGIPILTGSVLRLPVGLLTDRYGGRVVFPLVMLTGAGGALLLSLADSYASFILASLVFGVAGAGFAAGIAYTSVWFPKERQGTALGIFGVGNAGAAITSMAAPSLLRWLTDGGQHLDAWRAMPRIYAGALAAMAILFVLLTENRVVATARSRAMVDRLRPLRSIRVWRFGLYYFLVFGAFVALAQWLIPYYLNVYGVSLTLAGLLASIFTLPSGLVRALGGWLSDKLGARTVMYWVLGVCAAGCFLLIVPRMDISSPGEGIQSAQNGVVTAVSPTEIKVGDKAYPLRGDEQAHEKVLGGENLVWPTSRFWQQPVVKVGDEVVKKQLLARGITHIYFQANMWIFTSLVFVVGMSMGIGKAAVYKHIPEYFPNDVGVVGGIVGVLGGLGGFVCPILFGYLLRGTGLWTTCWMFLFGLSLGCLLWMHLVVRRMMREHAPHLAERIEHHEASPTPPARPAGDAGSELARSDA